MMACCYIAAFCISQLVKVCQFLDADNSIRYNEDNPVLQYPDAKCTGSEKPSGRSSNNNCLILSLSGLTCSACSAAVESALFDHPDVDKVRVSLSLQQATIITKGPIIDEGSIKSAVLDLGYGVEVGPRSPQEIIDVLRSKEEVAKLKSSFSQLATCAGAIQLVGLSLTQFGRNRLPPSCLFFMHLFCASITVYAQCRYIAWIHISGWKWIHSGHPNMNTLISSSLALGTFFSVIDLLARGPSKATPYYTTVVGLALVVISGRYLETMSRRTASEDMIKVYKPLLDSQSIQMYKTSQLVPQPYLRPSDEIVIEPFSIIPCDSYITLGSSSVNQAIVTGESMPVQKSVGDLLLGGTRNLGGKLIAVVHKEQACSFYAQIVQSAVEASGSKSEETQTLDIAMKYFVSCVMSLALLIPLKEYYWSGKLVDYDCLRQAIIQCMTILTCACPCALGLAIPSAVVAAANVASQHGILITKGFVTIQKLCSVQSVIFDKTGTLTRATLEVLNFEMTDPWLGQSEDFWTYLCAIEERSVTSHPIGRAIFAFGVRNLKSSWSDTKALLKTKNLVNEAGHGVSGDVLDRQGRWCHVNIGSLRYLQTCGISNLPEPDFGPDNRSFIAVYVALDNTYAGTLYITDMVRDGAAAVTRELQLMGLETGLLTGDVPQSAHRVSQLLNLPVIAAEAAPQDKLDHVRSLQNAGRIIAMVGDGLNDAPSLSAADIGIALYHEAATPTAGASIVILNSQLSSIPLLFKIAKHTAQQIRLNLAWVFGYNVLALGMAAGFFHPFGIKLTPPLAAALMSFSSIFVTLNGLWLRSRLTSLARDLA